MIATDWLMPAATLLAGLFVGLMLFYSTSRRRREPAPPDDLTRRDLEARRDALIEELRNLDPSASSERQRLENEAAEVLRRLDTLSGAAASKPPAPSPTLAPSNAAVRGFLWGAGSVAALVGIGYFVSQSTQERPAEQAPLTRTESPRTDASLEQLEAGVRRTPDDLALRRDLAKAYLDRDNLMGVFEQTQYILERAPSDPRATTYQAIVRMAMGQSDAAMQMLTTATKADPSVIEAWVALAWIHTQSGSDDAAAQAIENAAKQQPDERARLLEVLAQMRAQKRGEGESPVAAGASGAGVSVTIDVPAGAPRPARGVVFVIARAEGTTTGPPIAVKRVDLTAFPLSVELTQADSMMGQPLPGRLRIEARVDSDGVATTREPADRSAFQDGVALGSQVKLLLR